MPHPQNAPGWTGKQRQFMFWVATPSDLREERTLEQYCTAHKVDRKTLWRWKRLPGFWREVQTMTMQFIGDAVPESLESMKHFARLGSFQHQKLYFEMTGMYVPKLAPTNPAGNKEYSGPIAFVVRQDGGVAQGTDEVLAE